MIRLRPNGIQSTIQYHLGWSDRSGSFQVALPPVYRVSIQHKHDGSERLPFIPAGPLKAVSSYTVRNFRNIALDLRGIVELFHFGLNRIKSAAGGG